MTLGVVAIELKTTMLCLFVVVCCCVRCSDRSEVVQKIGGKVVIRIHFSFFSCVDVDDEICSANRLVTPVRLTPALGESTDRLN